MVLVAAPMELIHYFSRQFDTDGNACKVAEYSRVFVAIALILNLMAVTVERCFLNASVYVIINLVVFVGSLSSSFR